MGASAMCSAWLGTKYEEYGKIEDAEGACERRSFFGNNSSERAEADDQEKEEHKPEEHVDKEGLVAVTLIAQERTRALADGIASVLGEEMQSMERRQKEQQISMEAM